MNTRKTTEMTSVRKKLMAALAMLLVACIMTVSSTYAWFTLSTAPEVKGITTTVGANGNLEIALGNPDTVYGSGVTSSAVGSSMDVTGADKTVSNETWGNLIDLDHDKYGLEKITLKPSRLNVVAGGVNTDSPLQFPVYGTDGRVKELSHDTLVGSFNTTSNGFENLPTQNAAGVNGIGSASNMSKREFAVRNNKKAISSKRLAAVAEARAALALYSGDLAALALDNQESADTEVIAAEDVAILNALITRLEQANEAISDSFKAAVLVVLAGEENLDDDAWGMAVEGIGNKNIVETLTYLSALTELAGYSFPTEITNFVGSYSDIKNTLATAKAKLTLAEGVTEYTWGNVKEAVSALLKHGDIKISGYTVSEIKASKESTDDKEAFNAVLTAAMGGTLQFQFGANSGVFADIANVVGAYTSSITFPKGMEVEDIPLATLGSKPVTVESRNGNTDSGDLGTIAGFLASAQAPAAGADAAKALTDTYGYSIDFLFRTNAADSYLQLQTSAANRIYADNANETLMGEGSNMTFRIGGEYTKDKIDGLVAGIRVVFYDTTAADHAILGVATLDTANGKVSGDQYKLDLKLTNYSVEATGLMNTSGFITTNNGETAQDERVALTALGANAVKKVTALVYLDGDIIDNGDVGALSELDGNMNLQFSSSAKLTPMDNTALKENVA